MRKNKCETMFIFNLSWGLKKCECSFACKGSSKFIKVVTYVTVNLKGTLLVEKQLNNEMVSEAISIKEVVS